MLDRRGRLLTAALGFALLRSAPNAESRILRVLSETKLRVMTLTTGALVWTPSARGSATETAWL